MDVSSQMLAFVKVVEMGSISAASRSSVAFGKSQLIVALPEFLALYPELTVSLEMTDRQIDLEEENFDVAINFAEQLSNPNVIARNIMKNERILCASPGFLERFGTPTSFEDLKIFNCLRTSNATDRNVWQAEFNGKKQTVHATGNFEGNSADAVYIAALAGLGIARLSTYLVSAKIASGDLVRLLPKYQQDYTAVAVTFAERRNLAPKIRASVEFLVSRFSGNR